MISYKVGKPMLYDTTVFDSIIIDTQFRYIIYGVNAILGTIVDVDNVRRLVPWSNG